MTRGIEVVGRIGAIFLAAVALLAGYFSLVHAWAGYLDDQDGELRRAHELVPGNASYLWRLARLNEAERIPFLLAAVAANPYHSRAWVELGIAAEIKGDCEEAERCLQEAAAVDRTFGPAWALTNFYYRRHREEEFWHWARHALLMSHGDMMAIYRLSGQMSPDPAVILERMVPAEARFLSGYLRYLLEEGEFPAAARVAELLLPVTRPADKYLLLGYCDRLIQRLEPGLALTVWNGMVQAQLLPGEYSLHPRDGSFVTNGDFRWPPLGSGFDWRTGKAEGVRVRFAGRAVGARLALNGRQADECLLLEQFVPAMPERDYVLNVRYRSSVISGDGGLFAEVTDGADGRRLAEPAPLLLSSDWAKLSITIRPGAPVTRLRLVYRREQGHPPLQCRLDLTSVELIQE